MADKDSGDDKVDRKYLTPPEVAERYGVPLDTVLDWISFGDLRAYEIDWRIPFSALGDLEKRRPNLRPRVEATR